MWQIFLGSFTLSVVHAFIPNHWIPLIALAKSEKWSMKETLVSTGITGVSHTLSTILIGIFVGFAGIKLSEEFTFVTRIAAPLVLFVLGIFYLLIDWRSSHHHQHHHFDVNEPVINHKKSKTAILFTLSIGMFFSPCIEVEAFFFQAGTLGWSGIFIVSLVYLLVTLALMLTLVYLGLKGVNKFDSHLLEHHEKRIIGIVLILLGLLAYFVEF